MDKPNHSPAIGARIRSRRKALGVKQEELAKAVGAGQSSIAKYESGRREMNASELMTFAETLNVPVSYFYGGFDPYDWQSQVSPKEEWTTGTIPNGGFTVTASGSRSAHMTPSAYARATADADEEQLLSFYRRLSPVLKKTAISVVASLSAGQPEINQAVHEEYLK